ncbi:MAG: SMC-Scp complex subunit ScpB [Thermoflexia bacterium]|nr:MAG: SMC-Scp complex subunit ScpB [Thermoflexia bacterium]
MAEEPSLPTLLESLLFVADEPVSVGQLATVLEVPPAAVEKALEDLNQQLAGRGLRLQRLGERVQLATMPEAAPYVERMLGLGERRRLSQAALETLAIIAYRQPISRSEIEAIRGVNCDSVLRTLLAAGLIEETGRASAPGRPILYATTFAFLQHFGLHSPADLPPLEIPEESPG